MKFILALLCLLLAPSVLAATIATSVHFESTSIDARNYTKANTAFLANLVFTKDPQYGNLLFSPGTLNDRAEANIPVPTAACPNNVCTVPVSIYIPATRGTTYKDVQFTLTAQGATQTINQRFFIDTIPPTLTSIGTPTCKQNCALKTGRNTITAYFTEDGSGMDAANTYLLYGAPVRADSCAKNACNFTVDYSTQGQVSLRLSSAKDVAGNSVAAQNTEYAFTVDNDEPQVTAVSATPGKGLVVTGPFTLRVAVDDATPVAATARQGTATMDLTCTESLCTGRIVPPVDATATTLTITVTDSAGNTATKTAEFQIAKSTSAEGEFWSAQATATPTAIDKATLNHFKKTLYLRTTLDTAQDAQIASMHVGACTFSADKPVTKTTAEGVQTIVENAVISLPQENVRVLGDTTQTPTIMLTIGATPALNDITGELTVLCELQVYTLSEGQLYERAQKVPVSATVHVIQNKLISERLADRQKQLDEELQQTTQQLALFRQTYQLGSGMCNAIAGLRGAEAVATSTQGALGSIPVVGNVLATPSRVTHEALYVSGKTLLDNPVGGVLCSAVTCEYGKKLNSDLFAGDNKFGDISKTYSGIVTGNQQPMFLDPHKSWLVAYGTACIPEIIYHEEVQHSIDCTYAACVRTQTPIGVPISACDAQKSNLECRYKYGGLFYITPAALAQQLRDHVIAMVANPMALIGYVAVIPCKPLSHELNAYCELPFIVEDVHKAVATVQQLQSYATLVQPTDNGDACAPTQSVIGDVAAEMFYNGACNSQYCRYGDCVKAGGKYYTIQNRAVNIANGTTVFDKQEGETDFTRGARVKYGHTLVEGTCSDLARANVDRLTAATGVGDGSMEIGPFADAATVVKTKQERVTAVAKAKEETTTAQQSFDKGTFRQKQVLIDEGCHDGSCTVYKETQTVTYQEASKDLLASRPPLTGGRDTKLAQAEDKYKAVLAQYERADQNDKTVQSALNKATRDYLRARQKLITQEQNQASKELRDAVKKQQKEIRKQVRAAEKQKMAESTTYTLTQAAKTAHMLSDIGVRFTQVASRFGYNVPKWVSGYSDSIENSKLGRMTDFEEDFLTAVCEDNMARMDKNIIGIDAKNNFGLYLQGGRTQVLVEGEAEDTYMYEYVVSGVFAVPNTQAPSSVTYTVSLDGGPQLASGELIPGQRIQWRAPDFLTYENETRYDQVCITLNHNFGELYPVTSYDDKSSLCVPLITVNEVAQ